MIFEIATTLVLVDLIVFAMNNVIDGWLFLILQPKSRSFRAKCAATSRVVSTMA